MTDNRLRTSGTGLSDLPMGAEPSGDNWTLLWDKVRQLVKLVSGRVSFGNGKHRTLSGNIDGETQSVYFDLANTGYDIKHGLGRTPIGLITLNVDIDGSVIRFTSADPEVITLRTNVPGVTALVVFV